MADKGSDVTDVQDESLMEDGLNYLHEKERQNTIDEVVSQVGLKSFNNF